MENMKEIVELLKGLGDNAQTALIWYFALSAVQSVLGYVTTVICILGPVKMLFGAIRRSEEARMVR